MKAMLLAAGRGVRMGRLTRDRPKALIEVAGRSLIEHQIGRLRAAGFEDLVINVAYLGTHIERHLDARAGLGVALTFSREEPGPLETGGGIFLALPLLGLDPFVVVNSDVWTDYPFAALPRAPDGLAHLVLVPNPDHHPDGDFGLVAGRVTVDTGERHTFSGIAVYRTELFADCRPGAFPIAPLLRHAAARGLVSGELYTGLWIDVGTPERLEEVRHLGSS